MHHLLADLTGSALAAQQGSGWTAPAAAGLIVFTVAMLLVAWMWITSHGSEGSGPDSPGGGGGVRPPDRPSPSGPPWWPEFERQFAEHVTQAAGRPDTTEEPSLGGTPSGRSPIVWKR